LKANILIIAFAACSISSSNINSEEIKTEAAKNVIELEPGPGWDILHMFSGKVNYYWFDTENGEKLIKSRYRPDLKTVILFQKLEEPCECSRASWKWRVHSFPIGADEWHGPLKDSPGAVYVYFRTTFRQYVIKYVWSVAHPAGTSFPSDRSNFFNKMYYKVLEGPPPEKDAWKMEDVDLTADFRKFFLDGENGEVPPVSGLGILTDGDATEMIVETDYAGFRLMK